MLQLSRTNNRYFRYLGLLAVAVLGVVSVIGSGGGSDSSGTIPGIVVTDVSRYAFVVNSTDGSVSGYVVDTASGRLKYIGSATTGANPVSVAVDPDGNYAYVVNEADDTVSQYEILADGTLAPLATATVATGPNPRSIAVHPSGSYVYVADRQQHFPIPNRCGRRPRHSSKRPVGTWPPLRCHRAGGQIPLLGELRRWHCLAICHRQHQR